ncbi:MAG: potassium-transporting ATPase subunit KdpA [Dysgonamonadaceae bacterium]|jgi:K+-transporting ATPase ATPase A chain|nr:potassium-transporting ATPase subunit KdpA [Dysgonamonadaceae bacterium]
MEILRTVLPFTFLLIVVAPFLGNYIYKVLDGQKHFMLPIFGKPEKVIYKLSSVNFSESMDFKKYCLALLTFHFFGFVILFILLSTQRWLPFNPQHVDNMNWHTALNTSISFVTNTNWQSYAGETGLSYFSQMIGLTVQNFVSAATGIAVFAALVRGITGQTVQSIGNFWVDLTRSVLYILLPLSIIWAVLLAGEGVVQNINPYTEAITLEGVTQIIPQGPAASQIAIKQLGTNGGGFFNTNSAHPLENPTPFSNFLELFAILLIPVSLTFTYSKMVKSPGQGRVLFAVMSILFLSGLAISLYSEYQPSEIWGNLSYMEGKETRNGIAGSVLWSEVTTAASSGSVNTMHDSLSPLSGMVAMVNMMIGEVIFGGVGAGMYSMIIFVILTVFIAGLMVGRTPEFLGKKIEAFEIKMCMLAVLAPAIVILIFSAIACCIPAGLSGLNNTGPHGLSEILYAFGSTAGNNGSSFAGLNVHSIFYNILTAVGMLIGRFGVIIPVLAIAGNLGQKKITPVSQGTFRTDNWLFGGLLIAIILIVGGLTFFPVLSLGPVAEHFLLQNGILF